MRIRPLPLPETPDRLGNFMLVIDRATDVEAESLRGLSGLADEIGAASVLVSPATIDLPTVDAPAHADIADVQAVEAKVDCPGDVCDDCAEDPGRCTRRLSLADCLVCGETGCLAPVV